MIRNAGTTINNFFLFQKVRTSGFCNFLYQSVTGRLLGTDYRQTNNRPVPYRCISTTDCPLVAVIVIVTTAIITRVTTYLEKLEVRGISYCLDTGQPVSHAKMVDAVVMEILLLVFVCWLYKVKTTESVIVQKFQLVTFIWDIN